MNVRAVAREVRNRSQEAIQRTLLKRQLRDLERAIVARTMPDGRMMKRLAKTWGNESWSAAHDVLLALLKWAPQSNGRILECGSGLSTLVLATIAARSDREVIALEHDMTWGTRVQLAMPRKLQAHARVVHTPIRNYGEFDWYAVDRVALPGHFGFVFCDGPPGNTFGGRYGLGPIMHKQLLPGCTVVLDDTERSTERSLVGRWCTELCGEVVEEGARFTVLKVNLAPKP